MFIYEIIHGVQETFRGLCLRLSEKTRKSKQAWAQHGYEPKSINPISNGSPSPADHYVEFVELYQDAQKGAGKMLNDQIYFEIRRRLNDGECEGDAYECLIKNLTVATELNTELAHALSDGELSKCEIKRLRLKLPELVRNVERLDAMLNFHEDLLSAKELVSRPKVKTNGSYKTIG